MKMKSFFWFFLVLIIAVQLTACGVNSTETTGSEDSETVITEISIDDVETGDTIAGSSADNTTEIILADSGITISGTGAMVDDFIVTISSGGTYDISGSLTDGQILVDSDDEDIVYLRLYGANIASLDNSPLFVSNAEEVVIQLMEGTTSTLEDSSNYVYADVDEDEPDSAIFSKDDLSIIGSGTLYVYGHYNDGIKSKDGLIIAGGTLIIDSIDDGIVGKDFLTVNGADIAILAAGDGLKSSNDDDATLGYIYLEDVVLDVDSGADAIQAETNIYVMSGDIDIISGGGSGMSISDDDSAKGLKCGVALQIDSGDFIIDSADDAVHSNETILVNSGTFSLASGDDGIHADAAIAINAGDFDIIQSYEGIESSVITINGGDIAIVSSDDGINIAGGSDSSSGGRFDTSDGDTLYINGGTIVIDATGDGIDANGSIEMTGGTVLVHGPTSSGDSAIDYDQSFTIDGGLLVAAGSSQMAQAPDSSSSQYSIKASIGTRSGGSLFHLQTASGSRIVTFAPDKNYQSVVVSSPDLEGGETYDIYLGGSDTGTESDGLYTDGSYSGGARISRFTISAITTSIN